MYLSDLATACRASGLRVKVIPGWKLRGRPRSSGGFAPIGILCHHTGGTSDSESYVRWMALTGRSDLPAPLAQVSLSRKGVVYVCAAGRANHAGKARRSGPIPAGDGNAMLLGIEAMNTGSEGWQSIGYDAAGNPVTQAQAYARLCAALCNHYGWSADAVRAHRETSYTGKWDPGGLDMNDHRADVARVMNDDRKEFLDMDEDAARKLFTEVVRTELNAAKIKDPVDGHNWSLARLLWNVQARLRSTNRRLARIEALDKGGNRRLSRIEAQLATLTTPTKES